MKVDSIEHLAEQWLQRQRATEDDDLLDEGDCRTCGWPAGHGHEATDACGIIAGLLRAVASAKTYQGRVRAWVLNCFGAAIADDMTERSFRFLEEALELAQSVGCSREQALRLVDYVFSRESGAMGQEVGGVMVTLAALTSAAGIDLDAEAERELARVCSPEVTAKIRRKQASKRGVVSHVAAAALPGEWSQSPEDRKG